MTTIKGTVVSNAKITDGGALYAMVIYSPEASEMASPGQFIMLRCGPATTLRRPISICEIESPVIKICYDVRGKGTEYLSGLKVGAKVDFLPPQGHGFSYFPEKKALLVGGGIGIYPLITIGKLYGKNAEAVLGFRNASLVNSVEDFEKHGIKTEVITDDCGFVTALLQKRLAEGFDGIVYVCGPLPMIKACAKLCAGYHTECEVSMEERMGCGVGACAGCVCKTLFANEDGFYYKRVCADGPVFNAKELILE